MHVSYLNRLVPFTVLHIYKSVCVFFSLCQGAYKISYYSLYEFVPSL